MYNLRILQAEEHRFFSPMLNINYSTLIILIIIAIVFVIIHYYYSQKTIKKKLEQINKKVVESEEKYKFVVESSPDIMFIQKNGKLLFANKRFIEMSGYAKEELLNKSVFDFISEEDLKLVKERSELRQHGQFAPSVYEVETINRKGIRRYFEIKMSRTKYNGEEALLGVGTDFTLRRKNLETIRKLTIAVENNPASIIIFDKNGTIEYANEAFSISTGYENHEAKGLNIRVLNPDGYSVVESQEFWSLISSGKTWSGELASKRKNGEIFWESVAVSPILNIKGQLTHYSAVSQDISMRREMIQRLRKSETDLQEVNATKDKFFSIIAHDLKNPFNAIMGYASLLLSRHDSIDNEERHEYIENINMAAESTYSLLENILEWSRSQRGKIDLRPIEFDLSTLINEIILLVQPQASAKGIRIVSKVSYRTFVYADENMIRTVLRNLFSNAIKFTEKGEVLVETEVSKTMVMTSIIDTGVGISDEAIDKIFRIDSNINTTGTNNEKGTGLGLILSKEFVNMNGGEIWINRMNGQGTIFNFTLPASK